MKTNILLIAATLFFTACKNEPAKNSAQAVHAGTDTANYTTVQWFDSVKNVGVLNYGEKANIEFRFKNTGDKPLLVINAQASCGCTVADYPKDAIAPGAQGVITAAFDTKKGSEGPFQKNIMVTTNTKGSTNTNLMFKGEIKKSEKS